MGHMQSGFGCQDGSFLHYLKLFGHLVRPQTNEVVTIWAENHINAMSKLVYPRNFNFSIDSFRENNTCWNVKKIGVQFG